MGIRDRAQKALGRAFDAQLADAVSVFQASYLSSGEYDPVTEQNTATRISYGGRGVFYDYDASLVDETNILSTDKALIALANEVDQAPQIGHRIGDYRVYRVTTDPAGVQYTLQLRLAGGE